MLTYFFSKSSCPISKYTKINNEPINLEEDQYLPNRSIKSLELVELEMWKPYINVNLMNRFINPFKFFARAFILFFKKLNRLF